MSSAFHVLGRVTDFLRAGISAAVVGLFCIMMAAVLVQVGGRYVFNYSIAMATELATFSQIWLVLLGSGVAMARNQHIAIDFLPAQLPLNMARAASILIAAITIIFLAVLAYGSMPLLRMGTMQTSSAMQMPMWVMYACLPAGAFYIALELLVSVWRRWDDPFPANQTDPEAEVA
jgi:TRAP-type C4-dicarboxylate transport system permease small subunit